MRPLKGKTAIVTGGMGDIGYAISLELAERGANVAIADLYDELECEPLLAPIREKGARACYHKVDISDPDAVNAWFAGVATELGVPTLVIPNAAVVTLKPIRDLTPTDWRRDLSVNLDGAYYTAMAGVRQMLGQHLSGKIVFIGSWVGERPQAHIPAYCVSKAGLRMLCKCLALDLAPHGIMVNEVAPGNVDAGLSARIFEQNPAWRQRNLERVPIRAMSAAADVAWQVAQLCDPSNSQMTGSTLLMDGGLSLLSGPNPDDG